MFLLHRLVKYGVILRILILPKTYVNHQEICFRACHEMLHKIRSNSIVAAPPKCFMWGMQHQHQTLTICRYSPWTFDIAGRKLHESQEMGCISSQWRRQSFSFFPGKLKVVKPCHTLLSLVFSQQWPVPWFWYAQKDVFSESCFPVWKIAWINLFSFF